MMPPSALRTVRPHAPRLLAAVPLAVFAVHWWHHHLLGTAGNLWWLCPTSNLVLAAGQLLRQATLIRIACVALLFGLPFWLIDALSQWQTSWPSVGTHVVGPLVGLFAVHRVRAARATGWQAWLFYLADQQVAGWVADPALNVNMSHAIHPGWERAFPTYPAYWLFMTLSALLLTGGINLVLLRFLPPRPEPLP